MNLGYAYLALGILCFSFLGILHKLADVKQSRPSAINVLLFAASFLMLFIYILFAKKASFSAPLNVVWISVCFGIAAGVAILAFQAGIRYGQIATSWLIINLSAGVPTLASIIFYREAVNPRKALALVLITVSVFLLWKDKKAEEPKLAAE